MRLLAAAALACSARLPEALLTVASAPVDLAPGSDAADPDGGAAKKPVNMAKLVDTHSHFTDRAGSRADPGSSASRELVNMERLADTDAQGHFTGPALAECKPCWMHNNKHPRLYLEEEPMGVGTRLHGFINGMAIAAKFDMNLGGIVSRRGEGGELHGHSHGVDVLSAVSAFLGLKRPEELFTEGPPAYDAEFDGVEDMVSRFQNGLFLQKGDTALLKPGKATALANLVSKGEGGLYYTDAFRAALRWPGAPIQSRPLFRRPGRPIVAIHLRRGDMKLADSKCLRCGARTTSDEWNLWMLGEIRNLLPDADFHVFSSLEGHHTPEEFQPYRDAGATVHLDDTEVLDPWAHFVRAEVVVVGKSSFSWGPALLNPNCVVYQPNYLAHLPEWISTSGYWNAPETWRFDAEKLRGCIDRVAPAARATAPPLA